MCAADSCRSAVIGRRRSGQGGESISEKLRPGAVALLIPGAVLCVVVLLGCAVEFSGSRLSLNGEQVCLLQSGVVSDRLFFRHVWRGGQRGEVGDLLTAATEPLCGGSMGDPKTHRCLEEEEEVTMPTAAGDECNITAA